MLEIRDLSFGYSHSRLILDQVSFRCEPGQCTAVLGNNGCGKTTLVKLIDRILTPQAGEVVLGDHNLARMSRIELSKQIAYVSQDHQPGLATVFDTVLLGRKPYIKIRATERDYEVTEKVLRQLHLEDYAMRCTNELSGGEYQKVVLGRALAQEPKVLLLDEPTSNLDMKNQKEVLELVADVVDKTGMIALVVIHDVNSALRYCNQFVYLRHGTVYAVGGPETATDEIISAVYGLPVQVEQIHGHPVVVSA